MNIFDWLKPGTNRAGTVMEAKEDTKMETEIREQLEDSVKEARLKRVRQRQEKMFMSVKQSGDDKNKISERERLKSIDRN